MASNPTKHANSVSVITTARLHMGFFDLNGGLGRRYGSIGLALDCLATELRASRAEVFRAEGPGAPRAVKLAQKLAKELNLQGGLHMQLTQATPEHAGLGSGTQMALAVGHALSSLYGLGLTTNDIAKLTERGARSGIGVGTFACGGVIVDGGHGTQTQIPPVIARADFPQAWRILLILDNAEAGVHGAQEFEAFQNLPAFPVYNAALMCRHVLMQALPALAEQDLATFGAAISVLQQHTGDYFAPVQGGRYASPRVAAALQWLEDAGVACYGQSSWGPTGFAIFGSEAGAGVILNKLLKAFSHETTLQFMLCKARNHGAIVKDLR